MVGKLIAGAITPITNLASKKIDANSARDKLQASLAEAKEKGETSITLSNNELSRLMVNAQAGSWRDEAATLIILAPVIALIIGALFYPPVFVKAEELLLHLDQLNWKSGWGMLVALALTTSLGVKLWK